jgi:hypothetical protein
MKPFTEKQYFRQLWIWSVLFAVNLYFLYILWKAFYNLSKPPPDPEQEVSLAIGVIGLLLVNAILLFARLETRIDLEGIHYRFLPFIPYWRKRLWSEIDSVSVRKYSPILEYGGWGVRIGMMGKGWAVNVSGNRGLKLKSKQKRDFLIGTSRPQELLAFLQQLHQDGIAPDPGNSVRDSD